MLQRPNRDLSFACVVGSFNWRIATVVALNSFICLGWTTRPRWVIFLAKIEQLFNLWGSPAFPQQLRYSLKMHHVIIYVLQKDHYIV